jgi:hypothetical protein
MTGRDRAPVLGSDRTPGIPRQLYPGWGSDMGKLCRPRGERR